jgi:UDP-N-acetylglucosamine:LPS N-acetylglucosamine transferase
MTVVHPPAPAGRRVLVVSGSVGAGHDGAARELAHRLRAASVEVDVRDYLDAVPRWLALALRDGYSGSVGHLPGAFQLLFSRIEREGPVWRMTRALCALAEREIARWLATGYGAVVSTYPLASQVLGELRAKGVCTVPVLTYLTDPAAHRCWLHPAVDRHLTVTDATAAQAKAEYGAALTPAGPLVPRRFADMVPRAELAQLCRELALPAGRPVALLAGGSLGIGLWSSIVDVAEAGFVPLVLCGRNEGLRRRLATVPQAVPLGWRSDVDVLMQLADVMVHNAGGLSFTESLVSGLPAVTYQPIPGHGRANAAVLDRYGLAPWARSADELAVALRAQVRRGRRPAPAGDPAEAVLAALHPIPVAA